MKTLLTKIFTIISLVVLITTPQVAAFTEGDFSCVLDGGTCHYDPTEVACSDTAPAAPVAPSGAVTGGSVYILGDSIAVKATPDYKTAFTAAGMTANIDASSSRSLSGAGIDGNKLTGMAAIAADTTDIKAAAAIVVALGTNGGDTPTSVDKAIAALRAINATAPIFWVDTISVDRADAYNKTVIEPNNQAIYGEAASQKYQVISWFKAVDPGGNPQAPTAKETDPNGYILPIKTDSLGVHPTAKGANALAQLVSSSVTAGLSLSTTPTTQNASCCPTPAASAGSGAAVTPGASGSNIKDAFLFFVANGYTENQAAGIVGNMMYESAGVNPLKVQGDGDSNTPPSSGGWGIVQFTPGDNTVKIAQAAGIKGPLDSLTTQLKLVLAQLEGNAGIWNETIAGKDIHKTTNSDDATAAFQGTKQIGGQYFGYERPHDEAASLAARQTNAKQVLKNFGTGAAPGTPTTPGTTPSAAGGCAGGATATSAPGSITGCDNPLRDVKNLTAERIDQGVDYTGSGSVYAMCGGTVININNSGWVGIGTTPTFIVYKLDADSPAPGKFVYFAEGCLPKVHIGQTVTPTTVICTMLPGHNSVETGWADGDRVGNALAHDLWVGHDSTAYYTAYGKNFSEFLVRLGAPAGTIQSGAQELGSLPSGWPTW